MAGVLFQRIIKHFIAELCDNWQSSIFSVVCVGNIYHPGGQEAYIDQIGYFFWKTSKHGGPPLLGVSFFIQILFSACPSNQTEEICEPPKRKLGRIWSHIWRSRLRFYWEIMSLGMIEIYLPQKINVNRRVRRTLLLPSFVIHRSWGKWLIEVASASLSGPMMFQNCNCRVCLRRVSVHKIQNYITYCTVHAVDCRVDLQKRKTNLKCYYLLLY